MNHPSPTPAAVKPSRALLRNGIVLGVLAALFAGGLFLLYSLTDGERVPLAQQRASAGQSPSTPEPPPAPPAEPADPPAETAAETALTAPASPQAPDAGPAQAPAPTPAAASTAQPEPAAELARAGDVEAVQARVEALESELAAARERLDTVAARTSAFADATDRIEALEADVAAARAAADAAAAQAADVAQRYGSLTADYARLGARFTPAGVLIRLDEAALAFAPGTAELPASADSELAEIAAFLKRHPGQQVVLRGHTDATGAAAANQQLSEERAAAVREALVGLGVSAERLRIEGVGAAEPIADNASAEGRRRNRRVDILLQTPANTAG
ncbi:OmpA family protein [Thiohalocapsa halophila]